MKKSLFLSLFVCISAFFAPKATIAQVEGVVENYLIDMPKVESLSPEALKEVSKLYEYQPAEDKSMHFEMRVPKDWMNKTGTKNTKAVFSKEILSEIVTFVSPPRLVPRSEISVQYSELEYQISAEHWVLKYMLSRGITSKGMRVVNEKRTEFFYVDLEADLAFGIHAVAEINGNKLFLMSYRMPIEVWDEEKQEQKTFTESFKLLKLIPETIESLLEYQFLDLALIRYPRSWRQKAQPIRSIDRMEVGLFRINADPDSKRRILEGRVDVNMVSYSVVKDLDEEEDKIRKNLLGERLTLGTEIKISDETLPQKIIEESDTFEEFRMKSYRAENNRGRSLGYEFWTSRVLVADYYYFFTMITPSREDDFFGWSRNVETYKAILNSFEPNLDNVIYEE